MNNKEDQNEERFSLEQYFNKRRGNSNSLIKAGSNIMSMYKTGSKALFDFSIRDANDIQTPHNRSNQKNLTYLTASNNSLDNKTKDNNQKTNNYIMNINSTKVINLKKDKLHEPRPQRKKNTSSSFKPHNKCDNKKKTVKLQQNNNNSIEYELHQSMFLHNHEDNSYIQNKTYNEMMNPDHSIGLVPIEEDNKSNVFIIEKYVTDQIDTNVHRHDETKQDKTCKISSSHKNNNNKMRLNMDFTRMAKLKAKKKDNFIVYTRESGGICGFSAHSYINSQHVNEDKLGININFKAHNDSKIDFYGIYDGHNGVNTAELLHKKLHTEIYSNESFPMDPINSIINSFHKIETTFIEKNSSLSESNIDKSGSCVLLLLVVDDSFYFANLGDSRAMISLNEGGSIFSLTIDHKPHISNEIKRIYYAGGKIEGKYHSHNEMKSKIFPGGLTMSRSIGDIPSKLSKYGGKEDVICPIPDIFVLTPKRGTDFILLATNSIYEKLSNKQITLIAFETLLHSVLHNEPYKEFLTNVIINIMQKAIHLNAKENMSIVFLVMDNMKQLYDHKDERKIKHAIERVKLSSLDGVNLYNDFTMENVFVGHLVNRRTNVGNNDTSINFKSKSTLLTLTGVNWDSRYTSIVDSRKEKETRLSKKRLLSCCGIFS